MIREYFAKNNIVTCPKCGKQYVYTKEDTYPQVGGLGIECPNCRAVIITEEHDDFDFPDMFYHFGANEGSMRLSDSEIQRYVDEVAKRLKDSAEPYTYTYISSGDAIVFGTKNDDDIIIRVCRKYYEAEAEI